LSTITSWFGTVAEVGPELARVGCPQDAYFLAPQIEKREKTPSSFLLSRERAREGGLRLEVASAAAARVKGQINPPRESPYEQSE